MEGTDIFLLEILLILDNKKMYNVKGFYFNLFTGSDKLIC